MCVHVYVWICVHITASDAEADSPRDAPRLRLVDGDVLIVDECSMVDTPLMAALTRSSTYNCMLQHAAARRTVSHCEEFR
jgi:hypothetical protein